MSVVDVNASEISWMSARDSDTVGFPSPAINERWLKQLPQRNVSPIAQKANSVNGLWTLHNKRVKLESILPQIFATFKKIQRFEIHALHSAWTDRQADRQTDKTCVSGELIITQVWTPELAWNDTYRLENSTRKNISGLLGKTGRMLWHGEFLWHAKLKIYCKHHGSTSTINVNHVQEMMRIRAVLYRTRS